MGPAAAATVEWAKCTGFHARARVTAMALYPHLAAQHACVLASSTPARSQHNTCTPRTSRVTAMALYSWRDEGACVLATHTTHICTPRTSRVTAMALYSWREEGAGGRSGRRESPAGTQGEGGGEAVLGKRVA